MEFLRNVSAKVKIMVRVPENVLSFPYLKKKSKIIWKTKQKARVCLLWLVSILFEISYLIRLTLYQTKSTDRKYVNSNLSLVVTLKTE